MSPKKVILVAAIFKIKEHTKLIIKTPNLNYTELNPILPLDSMILSDPICFKEILLLEEILIHSY